MRLRRLLMLVLMLLRVRMRVLLLLLLLMLQVSLLLLSLSLMLLLHIKMLRRQMPVRGRRRGRNDPRRRLSLAVRIHHLVRHVVMVRRHRRRAVRTAGIIRVARRIGV